MKTALFFMDECVLDSLDLCALTGVLVPTEAYIAVRDEMSQLVWSVLSAPPKTIPAPVELHARLLLSELKDRDQNSLDEARLRVFAEATAIVNRHRLGVYWVAYRNHREIRRWLLGDPKLYSLNFNNLMGLLAPVLADTLVIPVMDGIPDSSNSSAKPPRIDPQLVRAFAASIRFVHHCRASKLMDTDAHNVGEPVFGDSAYSTMLQLVDLVSYMLLQLEKADGGAGSSSDFARAVLDRANALDRSLLVSWSGTMTFSPSASTP